MKGRVVRKSNRVNNDPVFWWALLGKTTRFFTGKKVYEKMFSTKRNEGPPKKKRSDPFVRATPKACLSKYSRKPFTVWISPL